jgi:NAD(P)H-dependent FMN reductase
MSKKIQLIIGSTRQGRVAPRVAEWVAAQAAQVEGIDLEVVDLNDWKLPFMDAPIAPLYAEVPGEAAAAWRAKLAEAEGFIFLTPEYNRSIPASLKNALDYTVAEWNDKPATVVSYGYVDGGKSAAKHLHDVLGWLRMRPTQPVSILFQKEWVDANGQLQLDDEKLGANSADMQTALAELVA